MALASGCPDLVEKAAALPILRRASFRARAAWAGSKGNPAEACQIVTENLAPPLDKIDVAFPEGADAYGLTMKALVEWRAGNYEKSRLLLSAAAPQKDAPPLAWYLLGCAEYRNGAFDRAWAAFQKFLSAGDHVIYPE